MLALVFIASCGNYMPIDYQHCDSGEHDNAVVNLSMTDAPPSGVSILFRSKCHLPAQLSARETLTC